MRCRISRRAHLDEVDAFLDLPEAPPGRAAPQRMGQSAPCLYCSKKPANTWAGRVLSEAEASAQVELDTGKRVKVKAANIVLRFEKPAPARAAGRSAALAAGIDLDLAWEFAPEGEFGFAELAADYFSAQPTLAQQAAALLRAVRGAALLPPRRQGPLSRRRRPRSCSRRWPRSRRRSRCRRRSAEWAAELAAGELPGAGARAALQDPVQARQERARIQGGGRGRARHAQAAARPAGSAPARSTRPTSSTGAASCSRTSPRAPAFRPLQAPPIADELPLAERAGLLDRRFADHRDRRCALGAGPRQRHASPWASTSRRPGLALAPGSAIDQVARARMSTVYMPGHKITMLPDDVVEAYTLKEGRDCPAVSLYARFDEADAGAAGHRDPARARADRAPTCATTSSTSVITAGLAGRRRRCPARTCREPAASLREPLSFLFRLAKQLKAQREVVRGKPESFNRPDYNFRLVGQRGRARRQRAGADHAPAGAARRST